MLVFFFFFPPGLSQLFVSPLHYKSSQSIQRARKKKKKTWQKFTVTIHSSFRWADAKISEEEFRGTKNRKWTQHASCNCLVPAVLTVGNIYDVKHWFHRTTATSIAKATKGLNPPIQTSRNEVKPKGSCKNRQATATSRKISGKFGLFSESARWTWSVWMESNHPLDVINYTGCASHSHDCIAAAEATCRSEAGS